MRAHNRVLEQQTGEYDFRALYEEVSTTRPPHLDHATYIGPVVVKSSEGRGSGLLTTKAVKAGDLLLCEKAFAHCYAAKPEEGSKGGSGVTMFMSMDTNKVTVGTQGDLITTIVQKLIKSLSQIGDFFSLHHGSYPSVSISMVDEKPVVDT